MNNLNIWTKGSALRGPPAVVFVLPSPLSPMLILFVAYYLRICSRCMPPSEKAFPPNKRNPWINDRGRKNRLCIPLPPGYFSRFPGKIPFKTGQVLKARGGARGKEEVFRFPKKDDRERRGSFGPSEKTDMILFLRCLLPLPLSYTANFCFWGKLSGSSFRLFCAEKGRK